MIRLNTSSMNARRIGWAGRVGVVAGMIPDFAARGLPNQKVVCDGTLKRPVTPCVNSSSPKPTMLCFLDARPKLLFTCLKRGARIAVESPALPMPNAPTPSPRRLVTARNNANRSLGLRDIFRRPSIARFAPTRMMHLAEALAEVSSFAAINVTSAHGLFYQIVEGLMQQ